MDRNGMELVWSSGLCILKVFCVFIFEDVLTSYSPIGSMTPVEIYVPFVLYDIRGVRQVKLVKTELY